MIKNLYANGTYDIKPTWLDWKINGYYNACPIDIMLAGQRITSFEWFNGPDPVQLNKVGSFRQEIVASAELLVQQAQGSRISVCLSGRDSEVICHALHELGADFDMWYANYWTNHGDDSMLALLDCCREKYQRPLTVVDIGEDDFDICVSLFALGVGICEPALAGLTHMFKQIPSSNLLVIGDGDIAKGHQRYNSPVNPERFLAHAAAVRSSPGEIILPFIPDEVMLRIWIQQEAQRRAQVGFHHSRMEIWAAAVQSPGFSYDPATGDIDITAIYKDQWPDLVFTAKTDQFKHPTKGQYKNKQRGLLVERFGELYNERDVGCLYRPAQLWRVSQQ